MLRAGVHLVSIVIPVLNEAATAGACLDRLRHWCPPNELIVADGGSTDGTLQEVARRPWATLVECPAGRGAQMNAAAARARHETLLFLHADTTLPEEAFDAIARALESPDVVGGGFLKRYDPAPPVLLATEWLLNHVRASLMRDLVGTNAIFVRARDFRALGGYREWPLLEDVDFCDRLKRRGRLAILPGPVRVSPRKYVKEGAWRRTWVNARVMFGYRVLSESPEALARLYGRPVRRPPATAASISFVVPTLNEEKCLDRCLESIDPAATQGVEVIVADGGSTDSTEQIARQRPAVRFLACPGRGRALQLNAGARLASGRILAFLHADSVLPAGAVERIRSLMTSPDPPAAGAFEIELEAPGWRYRLIERLSNLRNRWMQTPYGDQCLFLERETFLGAGGFPEQPFLEDLALSLALRRVGTIRFLGSPPVLTSARRFTRLGPLVTASRNALIAFLYRLGVGVSTLQRLYG